MDPLIPRHGTVTREQRVMDAAWRSNEMNNTNDVLESLKMAMNTLP